MSQRWTTAPWPAVADTDGLAAISPFQCVASREVLAGLTVGGFADSVRTSWPRPGAGDGPFPSVSMLVTSDPVRSFDPELSLREPVEIQVWPDGAVTVEVEFAAEQGPDQTGDRDRLQSALGHWAAAGGSSVRALYNDPARSLSEVWNARFGVADRDATLEAVVAFGLRAIAVGELSRGSAAGRAELLALLREGDAHAILGTALGPSLRVAVPGETAAARLTLATEICALANCPSGGVLLLGVRRDAALVSAVEPLPRAVTQRLAEKIGTLLVYPPVCGLTVESMPVTGADDGTGVVAVLVPPQAPEALPFLVHGVLAGDEIDSRFVAVAEPQGADTHVLGIGALHAAIGAGRALLRGSAPDS